jgi:fructose-1,6-bisphosphatase I
MSLDKVITIDRFILEQQAKYPGASGEFTALLYDVALAAKLIARETTRAGLVGILGASNSHNSYGEEQQKLDLLADQIIMGLAEQTDRFCAMASEEHDTVITVEPRYGSGRYVLLYDPLDGSSNIDVNAPMGTIFAIYRKQTERDYGALEDALQPGRNLAAAGYVIFGSSTMLVYSTGTGVHGFTLDPGIGEFLLSHPDIHIPSIARYYSVNQGNERYWTEGVRRFTDWLQATDDPTRKPLSHRYIGALVGDFHRNLLRGGIYYYPPEIYPDDVKHGKLRLMFESQALAFVAAQAGGYASDGVGDILDIIPDSLHQVTPLFIGSRDVVEKAEAFIRQYDRDWLAQYAPQRRSLVPDAG